MSVQVSTAAAPAATRALEPEQVIAPALRRMLTTVPDKLREYERECRFREAYADAEDVLGDALAAVLQRTLALSFKPEAIVGRKVAPALAFLERNGFVPLVVREHVFAGDNLREIWRYQWNVATLDRLAIMDAMNAAAPSMWLCLLDTSAPLTIPATVRFRCLKGSALPTERQPGTLRDELGDAEDRMITYVHGADEPIDVLRELGILFSSPIRREILAAILRADRARGTAAAERVRSKVEAATAQVQFDFEAALLRLQAAASGGAFEQQLRIALAGTPARWSELRRAAAVLTIGEWDVIQVGARLCPHDRDGVICTIDADGRPEWLRGEGVMAGALRTG